MTLLFLGLFGGLLHFTGSQVRSFENAAAYDISLKLRGEHRTVSVRTNLGPEALWGDVCSVKITASQFETDGLPLFTESKRSHRGLVRDLQVHLHDFTLGQLHVQDMLAQIPNCRFDLPLAVNHRKIRLSESGIGEGEVVVSEDDLEKFILAKYHEIKRVKVRIENDKIFVDGFGTFLIFSTEFSLVARLISPDGDTLRTAFARVLFDGKIADDASKQALLNTLDPVVDLKNDLALNGAIKVRTVELKDHRLRAVGIATIPEKPKN